MHPIRTIITCSSVMILLTGTTLYVNGEQTPLQDMKLITGINASIGITGLLVTFTIMNAIKDMMYPKHTNIAYIKNKRNQKEDKS